MKKPLYAFLLLIFFIVSFVAGARFNQQGARQNATNTKDRQILHYIDPMDPTHTSKEPGIAPCGMPMEPVYADEDAVGGLALTTSPGTVKINTQKQQIIGVQVGEVTKETGTYTIRALGRIAPDENRVYALIAGTDGWMGEIHDSTTGGLVSKNQLMAKIRVYDYDFFTWQQRYLTELGNSGRRRVFLSPLSGAVEQLQQVIPAQQRAGSLLPDVGGPIALPSRAVTDETAADRAPQKTEPTSTAVPMPPSRSRFRSNKAESPTSAAPLSSTVPTEQPQADSAPPWGIPPAASEYGKNSPAPSPPESPLLSPHSSDAPVDQNQNAAMSKSASPLPASEPLKEAEPGGQNTPPQMTPAIAEKKPPKSAPDHSKHMKDSAKENSPELGFIGEDDILYASKARQELLDLGVGESQLAQLAKKGVYVTSVELRSPIDGLVLSRAVSPRQRITRGAECFRVADLKKVWVEADLYDIEAKHILPGMQAKISLPKQDAHFTATVSEVLPRFDAATRTLKIRLILDNPEYVFRPDMFVDVEFLLNLPASIIVPSGAVINSGKNKTVYVVKGEGLFEPRAVVTGWWFNDRVEIVEGLNPGEKIVLSGNFLIDSESRMKLSAAKLMDDKVKNTAENQTTLPAVPPVPHPALSTVGNQVDNGTVKDPVCGMTVDPDVAREEGLIVEAQGKTYFFCSQECAEEFRRNGPQGDKAADTKPGPVASPGHEGHHHD